MINVRKLKVGQKIYIKSIDHTDNKFSSNEEMKDLIGKWNIIISIRIELNGFIIRHPNGSKYIFSIKDAIIEVNKHGSTKIIKNINGKDSVFDENQLVV